MNRATTNDVNITDEPGEVWRPVVGYEGAYEVSSAGRVRGLDRTVPIRGQSPRHLAPMVLRPALRPSDGRGHVTLSLRGHVRTCTILRLMREAGFAT